MPVEFKLPDVGEGIAEGELLEWHVAPGDPVAEDQVVAEVETDKAVVDVPSPVDGTVRELLADPGDVVPVGTVIVTFDVEGDVPDEETIEVEPAGADGGASGDPESDSGRAGDGTAGRAATGGTDVGDAEPGGASTGRVFAAPSTRRLARELGVDLATVEGSGPGGRVTDADVRAAERDESDGGAGGSGRGEADEGDRGGGSTTVSRIDRSTLQSAVSRIEDGPADAETGADADADEGSGASRSGSARHSSTTGSAGPGGETGDSTAEPADRERTLATPATRGVADELGVDVDRVPAVEERDGEAFVTEAAVREYAEAQQRAQAADREAMAAGAADEAATGAAGEATAGATDRGTVGAADESTAGESDRETREPYRGVRRTIGEAMERSKFTAPHVTHHDTADVTALVEVRDRLRERAADRDVRLTYLPFVMKAVVAALGEHPVVNTSLDEENGEIVYKHYYNLGVAVATDAGLMVPVVRDVDAKGLLEVASETNELVARARDRSIAREEMQGGTFTITNFGSVGGEYATPIVNYPETAILGLGEIRKRPAVHEGEVVPRDVLTLSLSIDHRVIDGAEAAAFVNTLTEYLEAPELLLLE